jgi:hypothetical protein
MSVGRAPRLWHTNAGLVNHIPEEKVGAGLRLPQSLPVSICDRPQDCRFSNMQRTIPDLPCGWRRLSSVGRVKNCRVTAGAYQ